MKRATFILVCAAMGLVAGGAYMVARKQGRVEPSSIHQTPTPMPEPQGDWYTYHGDQALRGVAGCELPEKLALLWKVKADGPIPATPVISSGSIFFATEKGTVYAVDLQGKLLWQQPLASGKKDSSGREMAVEVSASPLYAEDTVLVASSEGMLFALDATTGNEKWRYDLDSDVQCPPNLVTVDGHKRIILMAQSEGVIHIVALSDGSRVLVSEETGRCDGPLSAAGERIVFGNCDAALHLFSAKTGKRVTKIELGEQGQVAAGVAIVEDRVYAGTNGGRMVCADLGTGKLIWGVDSKSSVFTTPAVSDALAVFVDDEGTVHALDRKDGTERWTFRTDKTPTCAVITGKDVLVVCGGILYRLGLNDGARKWSFEISDKVTSAAVGGSMVVTGSDDGFLRAFGGSQ